MEKNYYEILEVNKNASPEIIEKAYKTLVKKYHPDLQKNNLKNIYEEKIKKINEAYDILSNPEKRKKYDLNLKNTEISSEEFKNLINENNNLKNELNYLKNDLNNQKNKNTENINNFTDRNYNKKIQESINTAYNKAYYDAYIQSLKNRGYKIKYKKNWKDFFALIITIIIISTISFILWHIPFVKNYLINLYSKNPALQFLVDLLLNIFKQN